MAKTLLAQVSEEDDEQIEQRIMTLEAVRRLQWLEAVVKLTVCMSAHVCV